MPTFEEVLEQQLEALTPQKRVQMLLCIGITIEGFSTQDLQLLTNLKYYTQISGKIPSCMIPERDKILHSVSPLVAEE